MAGCGRAWALTKNGKKRGREAELHQKQNGIRGDKTLRFVTGTTWRLLTSRFVLTFGRGWDVVDMVPM